MARVKRIWIWCIEFRPRRRHRTYLAPDKIFVISHK